MYGLGSLEPAIFRRERGGYEPGDLLAWAKAEGAGIAILQVEWKAVHSRIPREWIRVGEWEIPRNVVFGDTRIGWYAVNEAEAERLMANLRDFAPKVPIDIEQRGRYRGDEDEAEEDEAPQDARTDGPAGREDPLRPGAG
jgi:hypothetical protein